MTNNPSDSGNEETTPSGNIQIFLWGGVILLIFGGFVYYKLGSGLGWFNHPPATASEAVKEEPDAIDAWVIAEKFVKRALKSPGSANFGGALKGEYQDPVTHVKTLGDQTYLVHGWVDSQNSFGALIRTNWKITIRLEGETWNIVDGPHFIE